MGVVAESACVRDTLPLLQWLRRRAVRSLVEAIAPGQQLGLFHKHLDSTIWSFLKQAVRVPRDFARIGEALAAAPAWPPTTILVAPGTYKEELILTKPVTLIGNEAGEQAKLNTTGGAPVNFQLEGPSTVSPRLKGFSIVSDASCVLVDQGSACITDCTVTSTQRSGVAVSGAGQVTLVNSTFAGNKKAAVAFKGNSTGVIKRCCFKDNQYVAIIGREEAQLEVVGNSLTHNRKTAIMFREKAGGTVKDNVLEFNEGCGIELCEEASPLVEANTLQGHTMPTIMVRGLSMARLSSNIIQANLGLGIMVCGSSKPEVVGNRLRENRKRSSTAPTVQRRIDAQVRVLQTSRKAEAASAALEAVAAAPAAPLTATARASAAAATAWAEAAEAAREVAALAPGTGAMEKGSKRAAVIVQDESAPLIKSNSLDANDGYGILVCHSARPTLEDNELQNHSRPAIALRDKTECVVRGNKLHDNEGFGIIVCDEAKPTIEQNEFSRNGRVAVLVKDAAAGAVRGNRLAGNLGVGILVSGEARPSIEDNVCSGDHPPHIAFTDHAGGALRRNRVLAPSPGLAAAPWLSVSGEAQPELAEQGGVSSAFTDITSDMEMGLSGPQSQTGTGDVSSGAGGDTLDESPAPKRARTTAEGGGS